jgi:hypothetical protein
MREEVKRLILLRNMCVCVCMCKEREGGGGVQNGTNMNQKYLIGLGEIIPDIHIMNRLVSGRSFSVV